MPRINLSELNKYRFRYEHRVRIDQLNAGGHIGSSQMADLLHGRHRMLDSIDAGEPDPGDGKFHFNLTASYQ